MESFFDLINKRESCRNYAKKPVEKEKLIACIEAARVSPSACNSQPWNFVVVNSSEISPKVAACLQDGGVNKFTQNCPAFIVIVEEQASLKVRAGEALRKQDFTSIDIGLATIHLCLAATEQGLSSCIMGWLNEKKLKELLSIPKSKHIRLVVGVGYAADDKLRTKVRKSIDQIATFID